MDWSIFAIYLFANGAAAMTGAMFSPGVWYDSLWKPRWTPPRWMFPTAWTTIYLLSALAATRLSAVDGAQMALAFWAAQVAFNTLWSPIFFGLKKLKTSLIAMAGLWVSVAGLTWTAFGLDFWAGVMLLPYITWVTAAAALNLEVVRLNPNASA